MKAKRFLAMLFTGMLAVSAFSGSALKAAEGGSDGVVEIYFPTHMAGSATQTEWRKTLVEQFNEQYEGQYHVNIEEVPGDQNYIDKIKTLYTADNLPDVIYTGGYNVIDMMKDKLVDLTPYVDADAEWSAHISEVGRKANSRDGKLYGIPVTRQVISYFYNKDLFAQAGIDGPAETWEEFFEICDKLKEAGITPISMDTAESGWCTSLVLGAMIGSTDAGEEFMNTISPTDFNTPEFIEAAGNIQKLFMEYTTKDAIGGAYGPAANNFFNETTAMIANGPWMVEKFYDTTIVEDGFVDKIGTALYPEGVLYNAGTVGFHIASKTPEKIEASLAFVKFMTSYEAQKLAAEMCSNTPDANVTDADVYPLVNEITALTATATRNINDFQSQWPAATVDEISVQYPLLADGSITPEEFAQALTDSAK